MLHICTCITRNIRTEIANDIHFWSGAGQASNHEQIEPIMVVSRDAASPPPYKDPRRRLDLQPHLRHHQGEEEGWGGGRQGGMRALSKERL